MKAIFLFVLVFMTACAATLVRPSQTDIKLKEVIATVDIDQPVERVWELVGTHFDSNARFEPTTEKSLPLSEIKGIGELRRSINQDGQKVDVEIIGWEEGRYVEWEIIQADISILKAGKASYTLESMGNGKTRVTMKTGFKTVNFFTDAVGKGKFATLFKQNLAGLKHLAETGEEVKLDEASAVYKKYESSIQSL